MKRLVGAALLVAAFAIPLPAAAQSVADAASAVEQTGFYLAPSIEVPPASMTDLASTYRRFGFVALAASPADGGAARFATRVLEGVVSRDTVIVLTPTEFGGDSTAYSRQEIAAAFDRADAQAGSGYVDDFGQVAAALAAGAAPAASGGGWGGLLGMVVLVGAIALIVGFVTWRGSRLDKVAGRRRFEEAREEIRRQMAVIANEILEFSDRVDVDEHPDAVERYREASDVYSAAERKLAAADTTTELADLSEELDTARWELEAAESMIEGRPAPPRPAEHRSSCFFDPSHRAAVEQARLETSSGERTVGVCRTCADRLRQGDQPEPRVISVDGTPVPAAQAPRSHGGAGLDWLGAFSIAVPGMGRGAPYAWYPSRRSVRRGGGVVPWPGGSRSGGESRRSGSEDTDQSRRAG